MPRVAVVTVGGAGVGLRPSWHNCLLLGAAVGIVLCGRVGVIGLELPGVGSGWAGVSRLVTGLVTGLPIRLGAVITVLLGRHGGGLSHAAAGCAPVSDRGALRLVVGLVEEDGLGEPVEGPGGQAEWGVVEGRHGDAGAILYGCRAGKRCQRPEERETGIGLDGLAVDVPGVIRGHGDHLWIDRGQLNVALVVADRFLWSVLEGSGVLSALAEDLHSSQHVLRLVVVGVAEVGGPLQVLVQHGQHLGKRGEGLDARVPRLGVDGISNLVGVDIGLGLKPMVGADDLGWIGGGDEELGHQRIRIKGDGSDQLLKLFRGKGLGRRLWLLVALIELLLRIRLLGWVRLLNLIRLLGLIRLLRWILLLCRIGLLRIGLLRIGLLRIGLLRIGLLRVLAVGVLGILGPVLLGEQAAGREDEREKEQA